MLPPLCHQNGIHSYIQIHIYIDICVCCGIFRYLYYIILYLEYLSVKRVPQIAYICTKCLIFGVHKGTQDIQTEKYAKISAVYYSRTQNG